MVKNVPLRVTYTVGTRSGRGGGRDEEAVGTRRRAGRGGRDEEVGGTRRRAVVDGSLGGWAVGGALWVVVET